MISVWPFRRKVDGARILMYHSVGDPKDHPLAIRVSAEDFRRQLEIVKELGYTTSTVSEVISKASVAGAKNNIALTFDDGYKDNVTEAAAALKTRGMTATFYVTTSYIDGRGRKAWASGAARSYMDWGDVSRLGRMGFEIGSHMVDHADLCKLDDDAVLKQFVLSKELILKNAGIEPKTFSYPYGKFDGRVARIARAAGYIGGCTVRKGVNTVSTDPFLLCRTEVDGLDTIDDFRAKLSGYYDL